MGKKKELVCAERDCNSKATEKMRDNLELCLKHYITLVYDSISLVLKP